MTEKEKKIQNLYVEFQILNTNINQLEKQNNALENQLMELMATNQSLEEIKKVKSGTEILVPVSSGIYAKAELKNNNNFIVNVGSSIALSKDINFTKKLIENQINEIRSLQESLIKELQNSTEKAALLEEEINNIASELKK